jgi:hypothetical protein
MSRKIQIVLPEPVALQLQELADSRGEPLATFARQLVRDGIALAATEDRVRAPAASASNPSSRGGRPRWLEPYGRDSAWRQEMWGAVVALHGRYPRHLEHLHTGWWSDESQAEMLCALAVWRADIDDAGQDPREELAFHHQLAEYAHTLRQQGGGVEKTWTPGAPPPEWIDG